MVINKCSSDNWRSKIYKFVQSGIKTDCVEKVEISVEKGVVVW